MISLLIEKHMVFWSRGFGELCFFGGGRGGMVVIIFVSRPTVFVITISHWVNIAYLARFSLVPVASGLIGR